MQGKAGVFVSLHKGGELRGCIGTIEPAEGNIALEIINNAISAATRDPRFFPVTVDELPQLDYSVDVLTEPEPVASEKDLDPKKYGAIVEAGWRRGLLLPDLEGVDTVERQIEICRVKAGIEPKEPVKLYRFEVKRYK
jgi:AmmeMemoRadiSam system protein A